MKVYRFEHKNKKTGMFTTRFSFEDSDIQKLLQQQIVTRLMNHYNENPSDLPDPRTDAIDESLDIDDFAGYINDGALFGCYSLNQLSKWILNDKNLLSKMLKCGYFLYEIIIDDSQEHYKMKSQIAFKPSSIIEKKVIHASSVLKEFLV